MQRNIACDWLIFSRCLTMSDQQILSSWFNIAFPYTKAEIEQEKYQYLKTVKLKISRRRKSQLVVSCQVVTNQCCGLAVIFCGFISHLIGRKTINITEIFPSVHGFTGKTVSCLLEIYLSCKKWKVGLCLFLSAMVDSLFKIGHWWIVLRDKRHACINPRCTLCGFCSGTDLLFVNLTSAKTYQIVSIASDTQIWFEVTNIFFKLCL